MLFDEKFRRPDGIQRLVKELWDISQETGPIRLMEICGTHTMAIAKAGLRSLLPPSIQLLSGPGCPVCVTPAGAIDEILRLSGLPDVILASYGDLLRVPGSVRGDTLLRRRALGAQVQTVYSPMEALEIAVQHPDQEVIFLGVGFETTAPGTAACILEAKERGWIRHIGVTSHRVNIAEDCIASGLFETMQFPFSYISSDRDLALAEKCREADMGYIAMKGLAGGMLTNARACYAFMKKYDNVVPIWGIQKMEELEQWLSLAQEDPDMDEELSAFIRKERQELSGSFCRSCGYCMPCPAGIEIYICARMNMLLRRSLWQQYMTPEWREKMERINDCIGCRSCANRCPYQLDTPNLLKYMLKDYREFYEAHKDLL